jgi:hypothetical protein
MATQNISPCTGSSLTWRIISPAALLGPTMADFSHMLVQLQVLEARVNAMAPNFAEYTSAAGPRNKIALAASTLICCS